MIYTLIDKPINLSTDAIFGLIELHFRKKYKVVSWSEKKLSFRKLYKYQSNGWELIMKRLHSNDLVRFEVVGNSIRFEVIVWKQILVLSTFLLIGFIISWTIWELSFGTSVLIPSIPIFIAVVVRYYEIKKFINNEKTEISKRICT
ncbi:hypothetical protein CDL62_15120 [Alkalitalea saponilacus]|nr:hypothetical protein [Alkalitalea saponilacus]ASB50380.1 hypothetical protein CDL62_15120 [Alkalitalea saponilacus]